MLSGIKALKRYCKATLSVFFNEKQFDGDKKTYL